MSAPTLSGLHSEELDVHKMKSAAAEFYRMNGVPGIIERALNELFLEQPADVNGYLAGYFRKLSAPPRITRLRGREVFSAKGQLIVEAEVFYIVCNKEKSISSAAVITCAPMVTLLEKNDESQRGPDHVKTAIQWISGPLSRMLVNQNPCDQYGVDRILSNFFRSCVMGEKYMHNKLESLLPRKETVPTSPPLIPAKGKKSADKGKTSNIDAKPLSPTRPLEPVLHESMAMSSVSLAVAKSGAKIKGVPLYKYISDLKSQKELQQFHVPVPWITLIKCGKKSAGKLCLLEEVILISKVKQPVKQSITMAFELQKEMMRMINISTKTGVAQASVLHSGGPTASYDRPEQPLDLITDACSNLNVLLGTDVYLALNCAAPKLVDYSKGKYEVATGVLKSPDELVELYQNLISKYPAVVALIDPFRREDAEQWEKLSNTTGNACSLLSDITHKPLAPVLPGVRGYVLGHVNETTVSDIIHATLHYQGSVLMGAMSSETCSEVSFSDLAVGLGFDYVKFGGLSGGETMAKYNRLISIEEELAQQGLLVCKDSPLLSEEPKEHAPKTEKII
ncbi:enolase 4 [Fundulus heteroclitus]|uniref:enolase 4 n=1 Tax=Fundulus heteroclitus TaxID=8078 RepID=UPI00165C72B8|nr:enolase 4 [Fundulus heteroclitus]